MLTLRARSSEVCNCRHFLTVRPQGLQKVDLEGAKLFAFRHADIGIAPYRSESVPGYLADTSMKLIQYDFLAVPAVCPHSVTGDYASRFGYTPGDGVSVEQAITRALNAPREASRRHLSWSEVTDRILEPSAFPDTEVFK